MSNLRRYGYGVDRSVASQILRDVYFRRTRPDVPMDVVEAIGFMLGFIGREAEDLAALVAGGPEAERIRDTRKAARAEALERWEASR